MATRNAEHRLALPTCILCGYGHIGHRSALYQPVSCVAMDTDRHSTNLCPVWLWPHSLVVDDAAAHQALRCQVGSVGHSSSAGSRNIILDIRVTDDWTNFTKTPVVSLSMNRGIQFVVMMVVTCWLCRVDSNVCIAVIF